MNLSTKAVIATLVAAGLTSAASAQELGPIVITEIMYNPSDADQGQEWVEIYNPTNAAVDISRWALQTTSGRTADIPNNTTLAAHAVAIIAPRLGGSLGLTAARQSTFTVTQASWDAAWGPGIRVIFVESFWDYPGNPGSIAGTIEGLDNNGDVLQLINRQRVVVDQVTYATDDHDETPWPDGNDSGSIQLLRDFTGSIVDNNNGAAWRLSGPGDGLGSQLANTALPAFPGINSYGTPGRLPLQTFVDCNGNGINDPIEIVHVTAIDSHPFNNIPDSCEGDCNGDGLPDKTQILLNWKLDRNGNGTLDSCEINAHGGIGGIGGTWDTNANGILDSFETKPNIVITEIMFDPNGDDAGKEFVEIYNFGSSAVDISGWSLRDLEGTVTSGTIPAGTIMQPQEVIVLCAGSGPGVPANVSTQFRTAWNLPADLRTFALSPWNDRAQRATAIQEVLAIVDAAGEPVNVANYENPAYAAASAWPVNDTASSIYLLPGSINKTANENGANWARSIARIDGAYDSIQTSFFSDIRGTGSAGSPGIVWTGAHQLPTGEAVITEVMYHPNSNPGDPSRCEWIEVYNPGPGSLDLSGWYLRDEDGHTGGIRGGTLLSAGQVIVLIPAVGSASASTAETDFRAAWGNLCSVVAISGWSDFESTPNIGSLANNPSPGNEVITLRKADGTIVDIVNFDDANGWPADTVDATPGFGTAWSIALLAGHYNAIDNDLGINWVASQQGIGLADLNTMTLVFNGFDIASPGRLDGVVLVPECLVIVGGCQPADIADDQGTPLPSANPNSGVNEGDYNAFFQGFFDAATYCDIADDQGTALPPFGLGGTGGLPNSGVNEGDYNCFFQVFFNGCP